MEESEILQHEIERKNLGISRRKYSEHIKVSKTKYGYYCTKYLSNSKSGQGIESGDFIPLNPVMDKSTPVSTSSLAIKITTPQGLIFDITGNGCDEFVMKILHYSLEVSRV